MPGPEKLLIRRAIQATVAFVPWIASLYMLYWLEYGEIWTTATPHRGKISFSILVLGMGLSFLTYSYFARRDRG